MESIAPEPTRTKMTPRKKKIIASVVAILVVMTAFLGIYLAHENAISPAQVIVSLKDVKTILPEFNSSWDIPGLVNSNTVASVDYASSLPIPPDGSNVTSPNLVIFLIKNSSEASAVTGFNFLKNYANDTINQQIESGNLTPLTLNNFSGNYLAFYRQNTTSGVIVFQYFDYICEITGLIVQESALLAIAHLQIEKISQVTSSYVL